MVNVTKTKDTARTLVDEVKRQAEQLAAINKVTSALSQSLDLNVTLQTALEAVLLVIPVDASGISLVDEAAGELVMRAQRGWKRDFVTKPIRVKLGQGLSGHVVSTGEVVITGDPSDDPRHSSPAFAEEKVKAMVMAPMHARGKVIGVLSVTSHQPYQFDDDQITVLRAIADQVGLALENARLYESTREQQSRLQAIVQSTADAIIALDCNGTISLVNHAAEKLFEIKASLFIGLPLSQAPLPNVIGEKLTEIIECGLDGTVRGQTFELQLNPNCYLSAVISPVHSQVYLGDQQTEGWVVVFQDITYLKEAERMRLQFIQTAAHDLRNPLSVTLSALTMLHKSWKEPTATDEEVFHIAISGINRMQDLIDDLLNLERIESGVDFRYDPLSISDLLDHGAMDIRPLLERRNQTLVLSIEKKIPLFYGDSSWLYRALINLLSNAQKYALADSQITLRSGIDQGDLVIQVEDQGPGIPLDAQTRLFERFYRVRQGEDKVKGTGLGLAIVKSVAEKHGGSVFVSSEPGKGSIFGMRMPFRPPEPEA